jgi:hypothetical protein
MYVSTSGEEFLFLGHAVNYEEKRTAEVINTRAVIVLYALQFDVTHYVASFKL